MFSLIENRDLEGLLFYAAIRISIILICWVIMIIGNLVDFWSGTSTAKAVGEKLQSHGFRRTITKVGDYVRLMLFALMFDALGCFLPFYYLPFATMLCTVAVISIECRSVVENSRKKKAHAADVPEIVKQIVQSDSISKALELLTKLNDVKNENKSEKV